MKRVICFWGLLSITAIFMITVHAQTANTAATLIWQLNSGASGQVASGPAGSSGYFSSNSITTGSNLSYNGMAINWGDTLTAFKPTATTGAGDTTAANLVSFNLDMNSGFKLKPSSISLDCGRFGTDGGLIKIAWKSSDGTIIRLASNIKPNRISTSSTAPVYASHLTYDLSGLNISASDGECSLYVYIYSIGNTKSIGIGNVTIAGTILPSKFNLGLIALPSGSGTFSTSPTGTAFDAGASVKVFAIANPGYHFINWTNANGSIVSMDSSFTYSVASDTTFTANFSAKKATIIKWPVPTAITYGTALSATQLNAAITGSTGTVTYTPALGTVLNAGTYPLKVTVAADANYESVSKTVALVVNKATPQVIWTTPANITYGKALTATQLNAVVNNTTSTATYDPALGTVLSSGPHTLTVVYGDGVNYCPVIALTTIAVDKAESKITWASPVDINFGTPLTATQLNASVGGTSGTAVYSPALGTVLPIGTNTLNVTFGEDANYNGASASVTINVKNATAVESLTDDQFRVFPNPAGSVIYVKMPEKVTNAILTVSSSIGMVCLVKSLNSSQSQLDIKELPAGVYFFRIVFGKQTIVKRIVKI